MSEKGLWKKEVRSGGYKFLISLPFFVLFGLFIVFAYDMIADLLGSTPIPEPFKNEVETFRTYPYYIWSQWFGKSFYQFGSIFAVIFGVGLISSEVSAKTVHFLLAKPIRRTTVFSIKYVVSLVALLLSAVLSTALLYLFTLADGKEVSVSLMAQNTLMAAAGFALLYSGAVLFSTIFDRSIKSSAAMGLVALVLAVPGFFPRLQEYSLFYQMKGQEIIADKGFPFLPLLIILLVSGALYWLGRTRFARMDY